MLQPRPLPSVPVRLPTIIPSKWLDIAGTSRLPLCGRISFETLGSVMNERDISASAVVHDEAGEREHLGVYEHTVGG